MEPRNDGEAIELLSDWEQVQSEIVLQDELSVFPPRYHEDLQIPPSQVQPPPSPPPPQPPSPQNSQPPSGPSSVLVCNADRDGELPPTSDSKARVRNIIDKCLRWQFEILKSGFAGIASSHGGRGLWSILSVSAVVATAALLYLKLQKWRQWVREESENRLIPLIKEKDQKISQLLLQISVINEMISGRRKVPIVRVG